MVDADGGPTKTGVVWQVIITAGLAIAGAMLAAFWSLADPRAEIKLIRDTYLSIREHSEFAARVAADIRRLEEDNKNQATTARLEALHKEMEALFSERARELDHLRHDVEEIEKQIHDHERDDRNQLLLQQPRGKS